STNRTPAVTAGTAWTWPTRLTPADRRPRPGEGPGRGPATDAQATQPPGDDAATQPPGDQEVRDRRRGGQPDRPQRLAARRRGRAVRRRSGPARQGRRGVRRRRRAGLPVVSAVALRPPGGSQRPFVDLARLGEDLRDLLPGEPAGL